MRASHALEDAALDARIPEWARNLNPAQSSNAA